MFSPLLRVMYHVVSLIVQFTSVAQSGRSPLSFTADCYMRRRVCGMDKFRVSVQALEVMALRLYNLLHINVNLSVLVSRDLHLLMAYTFFFL